MQMGTVVAFGFRAGINPTDLTHINLKDAAIRNRDPPLVYVQLDSALEAAEKELERAEKEKRKPNSDNFSFTSALSDLHGGVLCRYRTTRNKDTRQLLQMDGAFVACSFYDVP